MINQRIPALTKFKCVVIMDNGPSVQLDKDKPPTFSSRKSQMQDWLQNTFLTKGLLYAIF
jgi:hypothetical protein